jgi:hypothetical protein
MEGQLLFDIAVGISGFLLSWVLKTIWDSIKDLYNTDKELADKVSHIEVLVAGNYVKTDKFDQVVARIFDKLDKIEMKIDNKVDK